MQQENFENFILFNVENPNETYSFPMTLKMKLLKEALKKWRLASNLMNKKKQAGNKGNKYYAEQQVKLFINNNMVGSISIYLLYVAILYGNSRHITSSEYISLGINLIIIFITSIFMYLIYTLSLKKFIRLLV
ncbi:hypothetical protein JIN86_21675 [Lysinibacillus sp. HST-98]|uniref:hypothetical protein n=1 Tax=Lysinibacillus sp. HST-98 TaxID=2800419 RepID=UPI0019267A65|nr:hypothetical protein [Lysinibacillus sp. HST-98]MBL3732174.1 hypothetical protein [Lysinibacillus sp. HST-98]